LLDFWNSRSVESCTRVGKVQ